MLFPAVPNIICEDVVMNVGELYNTHKHFVDVVSYER